jgi:hypothetical protein
MLRPDSKQLQEGCDGDFANDEIYAEYERESDDRDTIGHHFFLLGPTDALDFGQDARDTEPL